MPMLTSLTYPMTGLSILIAIQYARLLRLRIGLIKNRQDKDLEKKEQLTNNNIGNLFEAPVLFFLICILLSSNNLENMTFVSLAWSYVWLRCVHSAIHSNSHRRRYRAPVFVGSMIVLLMMWLYGIFALV